MLGGPSPRFLGQEAPGSPGVANTFLAGHRTPGMGERGKRTSLGAGAQSLFLPEMFPEPNTTPTSPRDGHGLSRDGPGILDRGPGSVQRLRPGAGTARPGCNLPNLGAARGRGGGPSAFLGPVDRPGSGLSCWPGAPVVQGPRREGGPKPRGRWKWALAHPGP